MRIRLSDEAANFLTHEVRYLRWHSPAAARRLLERIEAVKANLASFPRMGGEADEGIVPGVRRHVFGDYVLHYEIVGHDILVLAVRHGRMRPYGPGPDEDFEYEA